MKTGPVLYLMLLVLSVVFMVIAYRRCRDKRLFLLYFAVSGCILFFDYLIYVLGNGYKYSPGLFQGPYDTHAGALVNGQILPATAMLFAVLKGNWLWSIGLAALFTGVEVLFVKLGIFEQYWWKAGYTFGCLIFYFPFIRFWWGRLNRRHGKLLTFATLLPLLYAFRVQLGVIQYGFFRTRDYHVKWLIEQGIDTGAVNTMIVLPLVVVLTVIILTRANKIWFFLVLVVFCLLDLLMKMQGIIIVQSSWDWFCYMASNVITMLLALVFGNMLKKVQ